MKLHASALTILLSLPTSQAFSPIHPIYRTLALRPLFVGGTAEPPRDDNNDNNPPEEENPEPEDLPITTKSSSEQLAAPDYEEEDPITSIEDYIYSIYDKDKLLKTMGVESLDEVDPYSPDIYIKPRPGKYGWKPIELTKEYKRAKDKVMTQKMSDNEREENLKVHKQMYEDSVQLNKLGDREGARDARTESNTRMNADPWFDVNERMEEAVKSGDTEEIEYLKGVWEKVGGPPPSLKDKVNESGYVPASAIYSLTLSNERLSKLIEEYEKNEYAEYQRQDSIMGSLEQMSLDKIDTREEDEAWVMAMAEERYMDRIRYIGEGRQTDDWRVEERKEELDAERKKLIEKWKELGISETPEDYYSDWGGRREKLNTKLSNFATEARRNDNLYENEKDDIEFDEYGIPIVSDEYWEANRPKTLAEKYLEAARKAEAGGRPRVQGDHDVFMAELDPEMVIEEGSTATSGPLTVEVNSVYNAEMSDPQMRKHCFQYTVRITNNSSTDTVQLLSRKFFIQTLGNRMKDVVEGEGVTGRQPVLKPGEVFEYTSTAPLSTRPLGTTIIAARMSGEYRYCTLEEGQEAATEEQINKGKGEAGAELGMFHFVFPEDQRVVKWWDDDEEDDEDEDEVPYPLQGLIEPNPSKKTSSSSPPPDAAAEIQDAVTAEPIPKSPATTLPGEPDMTSGNISGTPNDSSDTVCSDVRVVVTSTYRPERSRVDQDHYCFAYNIRISNESKENRSIQLVSRRFEIQNIGSQTRDVVQGPGVTGRQPVLKPGENFEYTSTAPLMVTPMLDKTQVLARMSGEYNFVQLADDGVTPLSSTPLKAELGVFHFVLPEEP